MAQGAANHAKCARGKVYAPHLGNQWQQSGTHFSVVTGRNWPGGAGGVRADRQCVLSTLTRRWPQSALGQQKCAIAPTGIAEKRPWFGPTYSSSFRQAKAWFALGATCC